MLSGEGNENGKKTTIGLISKTLHVHHTLSYISLPLFSRTTAWNCQKLPSYTFDGGSVVRILVTRPFYFFFTSAHFHLGGRSRFLCSHRRYKIFLFFFQQILSPFFFISGFSSLSLFFSLSFARLSPTFSFSMTFSFFIFAFCEHYNYSKQHGYRNNFPLLFRLSWRVAMWFPTKKPLVAFGLPYLLIELFCISLHWYACSAGGWYQHFSDA